MKTTNTTKPRYRKVQNNICQISNGKYRCRIQVNGVRHENYMTSLKKAVKWVRGLKTTS